MPRQRQHNRMLLGLLALGLLAGAALTASSAQAVSGPGPYYAEPAWDRKMGAGRFLVLTNWASEAVLDKETGLVWERSPQTTAVSWYVARLTCLDNSVGTRKGWRLPSIPELASLIDPSVAPPGPTLPPGHPFLKVQAVTAFYWSATTDSLNPLQAYGVFFVNGLARTSDLKSRDFQVWCVRGGMNADQY